MNRLRIGYVLALVLLLGVLVVGTVLAQGGLPHIAPREVEKWPPAPLKLEPRPDQPRFKPAEELEKQLGFALVLPTYRPPGCALIERFFGALERVAYLNYSCLAIEEWKSDSLQQPYVGEGSVQTLTINGKEALYIGGAWVKITGAKEPTWMPEFSHELVFEYNGIGIRLSASPTQLTKEELIKIAESMH